MRRIRSKILLMAVGGLLFTSVTSTIAINVITRSSLERRTIERVQAELIRIADNVTDAILVDDRLTLNEIVNHAAEHRSEVRYLFLLSASGEVLASTFLDGAPRDLYGANRLGPEEEWRVRTLATEEGGIVDVAHGVLGGAAGELHMGLHKSAVTAVADEAVRTLVVIQIGSLALAIFASFLLAQLLVRPIEHLVDVIRRVGSGDLAVATGVASRDEIGRLGRAFDAMLRALRRSQRELRDLAARAQAVVASFPNALFVTDSDGQIESVNPAACALTGMSEQELTETNLSELFTSGSKSQPIQDLGRALRGGGITLSYAMKLRRADGKALPVAFQSAAMSLPDGELRGFVIEVRDLSRLQSAIDMLREQQTMLAESDVDLGSFGTGPDEGSEQMATYLVRSDRLATLGQLAASVAHELNNPLFSIITCASILQRDLAPPDGELDPERLLQTVTTIQAESKRCSHIVRGFLDYARVGVPEEQEVDFAAMFEEIRALVAANAREHKVDVEIDIEASCAVQGDAHLLHQVFLNLVINSLQAMASGGTLTVTARRAADGGVDLVVADTGEGMPPELVPKAFEPFFTTKEKGVGTGLGLAIARSIIQRHHGTIEMESELGVGTEVRVHLPPRAAEEAEQ